MLIGMIERVMGGMIERVMNGMIERVMNGMVERVMGGMSGGFTFIWFDCWIRNAFTISHVNSL